MHVQRHAGTAVLLLILLLAGTPLPGMAAAVPRETSVFNTAQSGDAKAEDTGLVRSSLFDDLQVIQSDEAGLVFRLRPRYGPTVDNEHGLGVSCAHSTDPDQPRRRLQVALPPGAEPRVELLEARTTSRRGPFGLAGFVGDNPVPLLSWDTLVWGDVEVLALRLDLLRVNGEQVELVEEALVRVEFGAAGGFSGSRSLLSLDELKSGLLNPGQALGWARPRLAARDGSPLWDGDTWVRIPIAEEGLYQIQPAQLAALGLQPQQLNPLAFKLYSYGGTVIDDNPSAPRNNEFVPREVPMIRETNSDASFDATERLLFYGRGTSGLKTGGNGAIAVADHLYDDINQYWLLLGGTQPGRSMGQLTDPTGDESLVLPSVRWRGLVIEHKNYGEGSARSCVGDEFSGGTQASYTFSAPLAGSTVLRLEYDFYPEILMPSDFLRIMANGQVFTSQGYPHSTQLEATLPLTGNQLTLSVERLTDTGRSIFLNWLCPSFEAPARFVDGEIHFELPSVPGSYEVQIQQAPASFYLLDVTDFDSLRVTRSSVLRDRIHPLAADSTVGRARLYYGAETSAIRTTSGLVLDNMPDLKALAGSAELIVVAPSIFAAAAQELVDDKNTSGVASARLMLLEDVYKEFNCGVKDPAALRNCLRHEWLAATTPAKYVLLVGNGHYDYRGLVVGGVPLRMPAWYYPSSSLTDADAMIDDFFVRLQDSRYLNMTLGRLPANSEQDVRHYVEKLAQYQVGLPRGLWRNRLLFVGDDEHGESGRVDGFEMTHSRDTEDLIRDQVPQDFDVERLFLFEYPSVYNPAVRVMEKPLAEQRLVTALNEGTALVNYMGHGNNTTWAHEYVFNAPRHFPLLQATGKPSLFVAATCSWAEIDLPIGQAFPQQLVNMAGGGAIGIVAATRKTTGYSNSIYANTLFNLLFTRYTDGSAPITLAEAMRRAKNTSYDDNRAKYVYLGDPSLMPCFPEGGGAVLGLRSGGEAVDTLLSHALAEVEATTYRAGDSDSVVSGQATATFRLASMTRRHDYDPYTRGGAYHGFYLEYESPGALVFSGSSAITGGRINSRFMVPADAAESRAPGQLRLYYQGETIGQGGSDGIIHAELPLARNPSPLADELAPRLELFINGRQWREDDWVAPNSAVLLEIADSSGVNLTGEIGHRIEVEIDGGSPHDLTASFQYLEGSYTSGRARLELPMLEAGEHRLRARAFDNFNNPGYAETTFRLLDPVEPALVELVNFPNPVSDQTQFTFQIHGAQQDAPADFELQVFTVKGRRVTRERLSLSGHSGFLWSEDWRPRNDQGESLGRGVYLYRVSLKLPELTYSQVSATGEYLVRRQRAANLEATGKMIVR